MDAERIEVERTVVELEALLRKVWSGHPDGDWLDPDESLRGQGVDSGTLITFLARIEDAFDIEWYLDTPAGALRSLRSIAGAILAARRGAAAPSEHVEAR